MREFLVGKGREGEGRWSEKGGFLGSENFFLLEWKMDFGIWNSGILESWKFGTPEEKFTQRHPFCTDQIPIQTRHT